MPIYRSRPVPTARRRHSFGWLRTPPRCGARLRKAIPTVLPAAPPASPSSVRPYEAAPARGRAAPADQRRRQTSTALQRRACQLAGEGLVVVAVLAVVLGRVVEGGCCTSALGPSGGSVLVKAWR